MPWYLPTICFMFFTSTSSIVSTIPPAPSTTALSSGQSQYQQLSVKARLPKYGPCWLSSLSTLSTTCDQLTDETQARLALQFTNCFLAQAGQQEYPCEEEEDIAICLQDVDNNAFTAYSNFYTHTQNMCYFIKSQEWQEMQDNTINKLSSSSAMVAREMEESINIQREIARAQQDSLIYQKQLAENGSYLNHVIEASKGNVRVMLEEFRMSTNEQKDLIFEVFDRVSRLQNLVVSEVSWLYTVVFYSACLLIIYLVTATKRTADARLWLFLILSINFGLERFVVSWSLSGEGENGVIDLTQTLSNRIWMIRNMAIFISVVVLVGMAVNFRDLNLINNALLEDIKKQNLELKMSMEGFQVGNKENNELPSRGVDTLGGYFSYLSDMLAEDTGFAGDEEEEEPDTDSFNSTQTDKTFHPDSLDNTTLSDYSYTSIVSKRETTPTNQLPTKAVTTLSTSIIHSTPAKNQVQVGPKFGDQSRYNLRTRPSARNNETLLETPETFARRVKEQFGRSKRNYQKWKRAVVRQDYDNSD